MWIHARLRGGGEARAMRITSSSSSSSDFFFNPLFLFFRKTETFSRRIWSKKSISWFERWKRRNKIYWRTFTRKSSGKSPWFISNTPRTMPTFNAPRVFCNFRSKRWKNPIRSPICKCVTVSTVNVHRFTEASRKNSNAKHIHPMNSILHSIAIVSNGKFIVSNFNKSNVSWARRVFFFSSFLSKQLCEGVCVGSWAHTFCSIDTEETISMFDRYSARHTTHLHLNRLSYNRHRDFLVALDWCSHNSVRCLCSWRKQKQSVDQSEKLHLLVAARLGSGVASSKANSFGSIEPICRHVFDVTPSSKRNFRSTFRSICSRWSNSRISIDDLDRQQRVVPPRNIEEENQKILSANGNTFSSPFFDDLKRFLLIWTSIGGFPFSMLLKATSHWARWSSRAQCSI